jgi:hypothetical protein
MVRLVVGLVCSAMLALVLVPLPASAQRPAAWDTRVRTPVPPPPEPQDPSGAPRQKDQKDTAKTPAATAAGAKAAKPKAN